MGTITISATEGTTYSSTALATFTESDSSIPASDFTATIDWGDGSVSAGVVNLAGSTLTVSGSHVYATTLTGSATVVLNETAPITATATETGTVSVAAVTNTLTPVGTITISATEGTTYSSTALATFTESDSSIPASDFTATIDWGDGSVSAGVVNLAGSTLTVSGSHVYATTLTGSATVVLNETAPITATATETGTVSVAAVTNTLTPVGTITISATEGTTYSSTALATFTESDSSIPASDFTATIDWGDGSVSAGVVNLAGSTLTVSGSHVYATTLTGSATVVLNETAPITATATETGTVSVAAVTNTLTPVGTITISATEGTTYSSTALATFTESDSSIPASDFTATIDWGDGSVSAGVVNLAGSTLTVSGSHVYATTLTGSATVVLNETAPITATATETGTVSVAAVTNTLTPVGTITISATEGTTYSSTALATFTESDSSIPASDFTATIDWGDGSVSAGVVNLAGSTLTVSGSHVYATTLTGSATVVLNETAPITATATETGTVSVAAVTNTLTPVGTITISATEGTTFSSADLATFSETNTSIPASDFTATIDWGDGTSSTGTVTGSNGTFTVAGSHLYSSVLTSATATVILTENAPGTASATATDTVTVVAPTPSVPTSVGLLAGTPGDGTPQTFVTNLYYELLGRAPDTGGQAYWLGILGSGTDATVRADVVRGFLYSPEFDTHFVTTLYEDFLGRAPDPAGLQFFTGILAQQHDMVEIIKFIAGSQEYYLDAGGTDQGFVTALYRDLLGRQTDPTDAFWVNEVGSEGLDNVVSGLLLTSEGANKFFDGNYEALLSNPPVASSGTTQTGNFALANLTGNGWANLFFQGNPDPSLVSAAVSQLQQNGGKNAIEAIVALMSSGQFYG